MFDTEQTQERTALNPLCSSDSSISYSIRSLRIRQYSRPIDDLILNPLLFSQLFFLSLLCTEIICAIFYSDGISSPHNHFVKSVAKDSKTIWDVCFTSSIGKPPGPGDLLFFMLLKLSVFLQPLLLILVLFHLWCNLYLGIVVLSLFIVFGSIHSTHGVQIDLLSLFHVYLFLYYYSFLGCS